MSQQKFRSHVYKSKKQKSKKEDPDPSRRSPLAPQFERRSTRSHEILASRSLSLAAAWDTSAA